MCSVSLCISYEDVDRVFLCHAQWVMLTPDLSTTARNSDLFLKFHLSREWVCSTYKLQHLISYMSSFPLVQEITEQWHEIYSEWYAKFFWPLGCMVTFLYWPEGPRLDSRLCRAIFLLLRIISRYIRNRRLCALVPFFPVLSFE